MQSGVFAILIQLFVMNTIWSLENNHCVPWLKIQNQNQCISNDVPVHVNGRSFLLFGGDDIVLGGTIPSNVTYEHWAHLCSFALIFIAEHSLCTHAFTYALQHMI